MSDKINTKQVKLEKELGDLTKYRNTGWYYDGGIWEKYWGESSELEMVSPPTKMEKYADNRCKCGTKIDYHFLIEHMETKDLYFVGSKCINNFFLNGLKRLCIQCNKPNRCKTLRCKNCRVKCTIHGEYHRDNKQCNFTQSQDIIDSKHSFNSKYNTVRECFKDENYMNWLLTNSWFKYKPEYHLYNEYQNWLTTEKIQS